MNGPCIRAPLVSIALLLLSVWIGRCQGFQPLPSRLDTSTRRQTTYSVLPPPSSQLQWTSPHTNDDPQPGSMSTFQSTRTHLQAATSTSTSVTSSPLFTSSPDNSLGKLSAAITKVGMITYIVSMCLALPATLLPQLALYKLGLISKTRKEQWALRTGEFCARWLYRLIPFYRVDVIPHHEANPEPAIWVCNHCSALDVFVLLAADRTLRGKHKRPLKIVYWKQLEKNFVTKLLFQQCGFIPVQMTANKAGEANDYDMKSFKSLLKDTKQAFQDGFDVGILPEGQLNPSPEDGLLPCFSGAFTLARMSKRPLHMMALYGTHKLWHPREDIGMTVTGRRVRVRVYPDGRKYQSGEEFLATFEAVVGAFGSTGRDLPEKELNAWLDGSAWKALQDEQEKEQKPK